MVSSMKGIRLKDEMVRVKQILDAAQIRFEGEEDITLHKASLLTENILSMCLKEAVTNIVKHSGADECRISVEQTWKEIIITITDNGKFKRDKANLEKGHGLRGMRERLEFVNGSMEILTNGGTTVMIKVPNDVKETGKKES
jgi:two-component system sensor histidine kinase DesK